MREVNVRVLGKGLELLRVNGFSSNEQLLFADDTAPRIIIISRII